MPLDPQAQALLEQMKQMGFIFTPGLTPARPPASQNKVHGHIW